MQIKKSISLWKKRSLTLFGKVYVIKTFMLSKVIYQCSVLKIPENFVKEVQDLIYEYLWNGKRDRVQRSNVIQGIGNGGLNMVHFETFTQAIKASWITKILSIKGKWSALFHSIAETLHLPVQYLLNMNFKGLKAFPAIARFPKFYQEVILNYNRCKTVKPIDIMSIHEIAEQQIWGNENFKWQAKCLYFRSWIDSKILYIKDIVGDDGRFLSDNDLFGKIRNHQNILQELSVIKRHVMRLHKGKDLSIANYVNISNQPKILYKNKVHIINTQKSKFFYNILSNKIKSRSRYESITAKTLKFDGGDKIWNSIYDQKICKAKISKLKEFNYKLLQNIVPNGRILSKWIRNISDKCEVCGDTETTKHMVYDCPRVKYLWDSVSFCWNFDVTWKRILCGWPGYTVTPKLECYNLIMTMICYSIFKQNSWCKFNNKRYADLNIVNMVTEQLTLYRYMIHDQLMIRYIDTLVTFLKEIV